MFFNYQINAEDKLVVIDEGSTWIPPEEFRYRKTFKKVNFPDSLTYIGQYSFGSTKLSSVVIPDKVTIISANSFEYSKIKDLVLGATVTHIGDNSFRSNRISGLKVVDSAISIGSYAFANNNIMDLELSNSLNNIGYGAFSDNKLEIVDIPNSVKQIEGYAFASNKIKDLELSNSLNEIGSGAFRSNKLEIVDIPNSVKYIGESSFENNKDLREITLREPLESIGNYAFNNTKLKDVKIPSTVNSIGYGAFFGTDIKSIILPPIFYSNVPNAFPNKTTFYFPGELSKDGWFTLEDSENWSNLDDIVQEVDNPEKLSLFVEKNVEAKTLDGDDKLLVSNEDSVGLWVKEKAVLDMGDDNDLIEIKSRDALAAIENYGKIFMGDGNDEIYAEITGGVPGDEDALINYKLIDMGSGDDKLDAINGGLGGDGRIKMGNGNDIFAGFGDMKKIDGGSGSDHLLLNEGVYAVLKKGDNYRFARGIGSITVTSFEKIGSYLSDGTSGLIDLDFDKDEFVVKVEDDNIEIF